MMKENERIVGVEFNLMSDEDVLKLSYGEVEVPKTYHYRNGKAEVGGLHCERIFGPEESYKCSCGKRKIEVTDGTKCAECGVELISNLARRRRFGHIDLGLCVVHPWFYKGNGSILSKILDMNAEDVVDVVRCQKSFAFKPGTIEYVIFDEAKQEELTPEYTKNGFVVGAGAEILKHYISLMNFKEIIKSITDKIGKKSAGETISKHLRSRLRVLKMFEKSKTSPLNLFIRYLPVSPPATRPIIMPLSGGSILSSDINNAYRIIIIRKNQCKYARSMEIEGTGLAWNIPISIMNLMQAGLQESVDRLYDVNDEGQQSIGNAIDGKEGMLRQDALGKRTDYSGRSVITCDPSLKVDECRLPLSIIIDIYRPFIIYELVKSGIAKSEAAAREVIKRLRNSKRISVEEYNAIMRSVKGRDVLLNRAPTLHKQGFQGFKILPTTDKSIKIGTSNCAGFGADFDGDQMGVHPNVSSDGTAEAVILMNARANAFYSSNGLCAFVPNRNMLFGCYLATLLVETKLKAIEGSERDIIYFYNTSELSFHYPVKLRLKGNSNQIIETTVGRVLFNNLLPEDIRKYDVLVSAGYLQELIQTVFSKYGLNAMLEMIDRIKKFGSDISDYANTSFPIFSIVSPKDKETVILKANALQKQVIEEEYKARKISHTEKEEKIIKIWSDAFTTLQKSWKSTVGKLNPIVMMYESGARGKPSHIWQSFLSRGLVAFDRINIPITLSFIEGMDPLSAFVSCQGSRDANLDKNLGTADTGHLSRRIVMALNQYLIVEEDCGTEQHEIISVLDINTRDLYNIVFGRTMAEDRLDLKKGCLIVGSIYNQLLSYINNKQIKDIAIYTVLNCESKIRDGICAKCYGADLSNYGSVSIGESIGTIAAHSMSEPTMQLTLVRVHMGSARVYSTENEKLIVADSDGTVKIDGLNVIKDNIVCTATASLELNGRGYRIPAGSLLHVKHNSKVKKGDKLFEFNEDYSKYYAPISGKISYHNMKITKTTDRAYKVTNLYFESQINQRMPAYIQITNGKDVEKIIIPKSSFLPVDNEIKQTVELGELLASHKRSSEAAYEDIVSKFKGLEGLIELRVPENKAILAPEAGVITQQDGKLCYISNDKKIVNYEIAERCLYSSGTKVEKGQQLTYGMVYAPELAKILGMKESSRFFARSIFKIYSDNGIYCNLKHIEVLSRGVHDKAIILDSADSRFADLDIVSVAAIDEYNNTHKDKIKYERVPLSTTKIALAKDSVLNSLIFRETISQLVVYSICKGFDEVRNPEASLLVGNVPECGTGFVFTDKQKREFFETLVAINKSSKAVNSTTVSEDDAGRVVLDRYFGKLNKYLLTRLLAYHIDEIMSSKASSLGTTGLFSSVLYEASLRILNLFSVPATFAKI